jgi:hypothetical protein
MPHAITLLLSLVACRESSKTAKETGTPSSPYQQAVAMVVARGDSMVASGDTANARATWAILVGLDSANAEARKRLDAVGSRLVSVSTDEARWVAQLMPQMNVDHWCAFPARSPENDLLNMKMMGDAQLLPTFRTVGLRAPSGVCDDKDAFLPLAAPTLTIAELRERYGAPTAEVKNADGSVVLTYGRFRMFGDKQGKLIAVVFPSFSE